MKQYLGKKKTNRIKQLTGWDINRALTRGGWPHGYASVVIETPESEPEDYRSLINYKNPGEWPFPAIEQIEDDFKGEDYWGNIIEVMTSE